MKKNYVQIVLVLVLAFFNANGILAINTISDFTSLDGNTFKIILFAGINTPPAAPVITSFTPSSGPVGTLVTITGTDLSTPTVLTIGGVTAIPVSNDGTTLVAMVMPGATSGTIGITTGSGSATSSASFSIVANVPPAAQQGAKLVGTGAVGTNIAMGTSVSISADGSTAIVGGYGDNSNQGAVWVFTRSGNIWSQQGAKLVGTGAIGNASLGLSVSLSADGNTAIFGGLNDNGGQGAAWVFTRSGSTWSQQGDKLVGTGAIGNARQGLSVSLSADGNTAIVGGDADNAREGAVWVFTRSAGVWSQQGTKLVGTGIVGGIANQGWRVSLSADGNTALVGGIYDNSTQGAAWVFIRSAGVWSQQGNKLVGTGSIGTTIWQGRSVSLSADGNTALIGGIGDNTSQGAVWVFTRSAGVWSQQGDKLVGTGNIGAVGQGKSVSLSADGNTAIVGGTGDNSGQGAVWVYTRSGSTWSQQGSKLVGTGNIAPAGQGESVSLSADGNTAVVGGSFDDGDGESSIGAAWIFSSSTTLGIENDIINGFVMYPNPVNNVLNLSSQETIKNVQVYNILGQQVAQKNTNSDKVSIDISGIATGTYFVKVTTDKTTKSVKLIKY